MDNPLQIIIIILAIYGAVLSTYNAIIGWKKEQRKIKIFLEHVIWLEKAQIRIVNIGYRPITIQAISMDIYEIPEDGKRFLVSVPSNTLLDIDDDDEISLPTTIKDGDEIILPLQGVIAERLIDSNYDAKLIVFAGGKKYTKYEKLVFDYKYNTYYEMKK